MNTAQHRIKAVIADDERLARNSLKRLLSTFPELELIGEVNNAASAKILIEQERPDVVFLDIQMPAISGFELLETLDYMPHIIFVTAFDSYALKAFDVSALDYLVKPIDPARLALAVQKLALMVLKEQAIKPREEAHSSADKEYYSAYRSEQERFFVRDGERCWFVRLGDIRVFESEGSYTRLYFDSFKPLIYRSLGALEEHLDPQFFFRANRQCIVNLAFVRSIDQHFDGRLQMTLSDGMIIEVSRRQALKFRALKSL